MEQVGVVALLVGRSRAECLEAFVWVMQRIDAVAPALVGKGRIGYDVDERPEGITVQKRRIGERVALRDDGGRIVLQDHVHARQAAGGGIFFCPLSVTGVRFAGDLQQQRAGAAVRVVDGRPGARRYAANVKDLRDDATHLSRGVELPLALAALGGEVPHRVFVGVTENIVAVGAVPGKVERWILEEGDEVGEPVDYLLAAAQLVRIVEVRHIGELIGAGQRRDDPLVDLDADIARPLERDHVLEACNCSDGDRHVRHTGVFVADVLDKEQDEDIVLVLVGVHAAAQLVAARSKRRIEFGLLQC